ncbi:MAG: hypothetical protein ACM3OB_05880 [Acidobacteriota bacterium]
MNRTLALLFAGLLGAARLAAAGTAYVPLPGTSAVGSFAFTPQIEITNNAAQGSYVQVVTIATNTDGTVRNGQPTPVGVPAKRTVLLAPTATFQGLYELSGASGMNFSARLSGSGQGAPIGMTLPVISSANLMPANGTIGLLGLLYAGTRTTDMTLVNLGQTASQCGIVLLKADGTPMTSVTISMLPLSHRSFPNVLSGYVPAGTSISDVAALVSCDQNFFAYAQIDDSATGELVYVGPAAQGTSTLAPPGSTPPPPPSGCTPGSGVTCFDTSGLVFSATTGSPVGRKTYTAPQGIYGRIVFRVDVQPNSWFAADPTGKHLVYWFVLRRNFNMLGMLYFRGPGSGGNIALARHGIGLTHPQKITVQRTFAGTLGHTYRCLEDYNAAAGTWTLSITDQTTGQLVTTLASVPNVSQVQIGPTDNPLTIDMGFPVVGNPDEVPGINWKWSNMHLELYPLQN